MDRIRIDFALDEGAILRILGLIERRGFRVVGIAMHQTGDGDAAAMTIDVEPRDAGRDLAVLVPQLHRLIEVCSVGIFATRMASAA